MSQYDYGNTMMNPYGQQLAQNRLNFYEQQYANQYGNNFGNQYMNNNGMMQQQRQQMQIKCRPVSSYDEAKASMIDLDGSLFVFVDIANHCIYTKQIMLDGSADIKIYKDVTNAVKQQNNMQPVQQPEQQNEYVLKKDFDKFANDMNGKIKGLMGGGLDDDKSISE